ncbi:MAG: DUF2480 family protein [Bacteroidia bacterium]|jgi:hypothetical protein|nr:DUF2480 family protein [Bacteroidia bacterium]
MESIEPIENKVANSGLITLNLEDYFHQGERVVLDIKPWLFRELLLKEKDFREFVKNHNWQQYQGKNVAFICSADAIIPTWAYMLLSVHIEPYAHRYVFGDLAALETILYQDALAKIDFEQYQDVRVIVKGCSDVPVPVSAYVEITHKLAPYAKSIMYGEACSNVPIWKRK